MPRQVIDEEVGFEISAKFRRNSVKNFVFSSYREKNSVFFGKFRLKIQNSKKFGQNTPKFAEIYRNFGTKFRFR